MAEKNMKARVTVPHITYYVLPWIYYKSIGDVSLFSFFGLRVYQKVGDLRSICGLVYGK